MPRHTVTIAWGLRVYIRPAQHAEVQRMRRALLEPTRVRNGCIACHVYQDIEEPDALALVQEWASPDDLDRYLGLEDRRALVAVLELATRRPEVWLDTIDPGEGLERLGSRPALRGDSR